VADDHAYVQRLVSVVKMAILLKGCTIEEQRSVLRFFCGQKDSMQRIFIRKCFLFTVGSVCRVKRFTPGSNSQEDFYAAGFSARVKRWNMCISIGGGYVEK
jgi:hypothetical protein